MVAAVFAACTGGCGGGVAADDDAAAADLAPAFAVLAAAMSRRQTVHFSSA